MPPPPASDPVRDVFSRGELTDVAVLRLSKASTNEPKTARPRGTATLARNGRVGPERAVESG